MTHSSRVPFPQEFCDVCDRTDARIGGVRPFLAMSLFLPLALVLAGISGIASLLRAAAVSGVPHIVRALSAARALMGKQRRAPVPALSARQWS